MSQYKKLTTFKFEKSVFLPLLVILSITRLVLMSYAIFHQQIDSGVLNLVKILVVGLVYDGIFLFYFILPFSLFSILFSYKTKQNILAKAVIYLFYLAAIIAFSFNIVAEFLFWDEFGSRYNFIAVDYLVYTKEVIGNILESYPVYRLLSIILILSIIIFALIYRQIKECIALKLPMRVKIFEVAVIVSLLIIFHNINFNRYEASENRYEVELMQNGVFNLFSAFNHNILHYNQFYAVLDEKEVLQKLQQKVVSKGEIILDKPNPILRKIDNIGQEKKYNIMMIVVESLSAEFLSLFGNKHNVTPFLNDIIKDSMVFTNFYATGTRTVRGLEAITLSIPPTPGSSILRRPNNENLYSLGSIFRGKGYDTKFLYGGFGYFDNMNYFFANNGFKVVDRNGVDKKHITFSNIWGIADENLLDQAIREADQSHLIDKPFFSLVMTTSNHRPFTYPEGKIDIPSGTGRNGGVKYTDYAIRNFIDIAKTKPWFDNTIFIITADHCASSAGKTSINHKKYHIPLIVYAPQIIKPKTVTNLVSQIDLAPTLLGLLNMDYESSFFGTNVFNEHKERAFLATYQKLGYLKDNKLLILNPKEDKEMYDIVYKDKENKEIYKGDLIKNTKIDNNILQETITYYQGAFYLFINNLLKKN